MAFDEKLAILNKSVVLKKSGNLEVANHFVRSVPFPLYLAKVMKEKAGKEFFTKRAD
jgi:hypothetical protein